MHSPALLYDFPPGFVRGFAGGDYDQVPKRQTMYQQLTVETWAMLIVIYDERSVGRVESLWHW